MVAANEVRKRGRPVGSRNKVVKEKKKEKGKTKNRKIRTRITRKAEIKAKEEILKADSEDRSKKKTTRDEKHTSEKIPSTFDILLQKYGDLSTNPDFLNFLLFFPRAESLVPERAIYIFKELMYKGNMDE